jgi:hypothetical protein
MDSAVSRRVHGFTQYSRVALRHGACAVPTTTDRETFSCAPEFCKAVTFPALSRLRVDG